MDGEIIYFDTERGVGFITGRDGNRYVFDRADLVGLDRIAKGTKVQFAVDADRARDIRPVNPRGSRVLEQQPLRAPVASTGSVPSVSGPSLDSLESTELQETGESRGVFGYFWRCLTSGFADFRGRARRKEFWSFALISLLLILILLFAGVALDFAAGNLELAADADESAGRAWITVALGAVGWAALIIPSIAVTVRRIHDIGLSGWFFLLNFVPSVGSLIIFVFTLIPSQRHPNKWGPVPAGVRM
jgi:uncharacterized membrane protein YhaH (DUF805 family)/cold shock CspA family protein